MSSSPTAAVVSRPAPQIALEPPSPTEPCLIPAGGLGIGGINIRPELEHHEDDLETENRASTEAGHKSPQWPEEFGNDLNITPTVVQDGIHIPASTAFPSIQIAKEVQISLETDCRTVTASISPCHSCQLYFPSHTL
jgi:hypothetical protein